MPGSTLAHAAPGFEAIGLTPALVWFATVTGLIIGAVALRASWHSPRFGPGEPPDHGPWPGAGAPRWADAAWRFLGLAGLVLALACGWAGSAQVGANPLPIAAFTMFWLGGQLLTIVLGDWWRLLDPFDTLAAAASRSHRATRPTPPSQSDSTDDEHADWWVPSAFLFSFVWMWLCWPDGIQPRSIAVWLTGYTLVMVTGAVVAGRGWVRRNEAFACAFGALATVSPLDWSGSRPRLRNPLVGMARREIDRRALTVLIVLLATAFFDALSFTAWWADVVGSSEKGPVTIANTLGLAWMALVVAVAWVATGRVARRLAVPDRPGTATPTVLGLAAPLAALAGLFAVSHELGSIVVNSQNLLALLSDPFAQGWDLLGTATITVNDTLLPTSAQVWLSLVLVELALATALVVFHDRCVARFGGVAGLRAGWATLGFTLLASVGALRLLLGV